jgi:HPt (histidine-containing phosphotransfer) domain-containing protein
VAAHVRTPSPTVVDPNMLMSMVDGDGTLLAELVSLFVLESPRLMTQIGDAVARNDGPALRDAAHALKGSASSMSLSAVASAASRLERIGKDGLLHDAPVLVRQLEDELLRSIGALNALTGAK